MTLIENNIMAVEQETNLDFANLTPGNVDSAYSIYAESNEFYDEFLDRKILCDSTSYCYEEFLEILSDERTAAIGLFESCPFHDFEHNTSSYLKVLRGFAVYEIMANQKQYNIIFLEVQDKNPLYFRELFEILIKRLELSKKCNKLIFEVSELREDQLKACFANSLVKKDMVKAISGRPDTFIFEFTV